MSPDPHNQNATRKERKRSRKSIVQIKLNLKQTIFYESQDLIFAKTISSAF
jgi:hypothetical protein